MRSRPGYACELESGIFMASEAKPRPRRANKMTNSNYTITLINPWHRKDGPHSEAHYRFNFGPCFTHRGVEVWRHPVGGYLHAIGGMAITHRGGVDKTGAVIDNLLDGKNDVYCCETVAAHLRKHGFTPMSYADATLTNA